MDRLRIGNLEVERGSKAAGFLEVADRGDGTSLRLPLLVVRGVVDGPTLAVSGGVHGDEYEGPRAIQNIWRALDPAMIKGTWLGVPVVNVPAFAAGQRTSSIDGINMNRIFPGKEDGFVSEQIAHLFFSEVVLKADFYLDLHAAGNDFTILPMVVFLETDDREFRERELALARAAGTEFLWKGTGGWSAAHVAAVHRGIPAILVEIGQEGRCSPERLAIGERTIFNVMRHAGVLEGHSQLPQRWTIVQGTYQHSPAGGCFYPAVPVGTSVQSGQAVGIITDFYGETIVTVLAPFSGIVCSTRTFPTVRPGDWTTFVGQVVETHFES